MRCSQICTAIPRIAAAVVPRRWYGSDRKHAQKHLKEFPRNKSRNFINVTFVCSVRSSWKSPLGDFHYSFEHWIWIRCNPFSNQDYISPGTKPLLSIPSASITKVCRNKHFLVQVSTYTPTCNIFYCRHVPRFLIESSWSSPSLW